jgi:hypothetical protein
VEAACVTDTVFPATVSEPVRDDEVEVFALTFSDTVPVPDPVAPVVTVIQPAPLDAVQPHPLPELTDSVRLPPAAPELSVDGVTVKPHPAAWLTVNVFPPAVMVALRALCVGLADAANDTVPLALPLAPLVMVSHDGALLVAVHEHPEPDAVTFTEELPPPAGAAHELGDRLYEQVDVACRKLATVAAVLFSVSALFCVAVPVTRPL